jgi:restriction system protein
MKPCPRTAKFWPPQRFPTGTKVVYLPAEREVVADFDLPLLDAIPKMASCEYQTTKKVLKHKPLSAQARNTLYQLVIAQMARRTLRCIFPRRPGPAGRYGGL